MNNNPGAPSPFLRGGKSIRVLLVEDNPGDADLIREILPEDFYPSFTIEWVTHLGEARSRLALNDFDLTLLDLGLPDSSGLATVRAALKMRPDLPLVVMTGHDDDETGLAAVREGAQDYLIKGRASGELLARVLVYSIERHQSRREMAASEVFLRSTLDALSAHIAILDRKGGILAVNKAWREFGSARGARTTRWEGLNYLEICAQAQGPEAGMAAQFAAGIRQVLEGARQAFEMEYPCHGPESKAWFNAKVDRFPDGEEPMVVVAHENITRRVLAQEAVAESALKYRLLADNTTDAICLMNLNQRFTYANPAVTALLGYGPDEFTDTRLQRHCDEKNLALLNGLLEAAQRGPAALHAATSEAWLKRKQGGRVPVEASVRLLLDERGQPAGFQWLIRDISERKTAEEKARRIERLLNFAIDQMPVPVIIAEAPEVNIIKLNQPALDLVTPGAGDIRAAPLGRRREFWPTFHPDGRPYQVEELPLTQAVTQGRVTQGREMIIRHDGHEHWISANAAPLYDERGRIAAGILVFPEISELKMVSEDLRKTAQNLQLALKAANIGLFDWDVETGEAYFSPEWKAQLGYDENEIAANYQELGRLLHPEDREAALAELNSHIHGRQEFAMEFRLRHKDGGWRSIIANGKAVCDDTGAPRRVIGCQLDITDRRKAEGDKRKLETQLQQSQKMEAIGRLAGGVAHDFNNMLSIINGYCRLILDRVEEDSPLQEDLNEILKAGDRSVELTRQLLAFARKQTIEPVVLDLNEQMAHNKKMLRRLIGEDIELVLKPCRDPCMVRIDPSQLDQILVNLAVNSRDAVTNTGEIIIETDIITLGQEYCDVHYGFSPGEYVVLSFSDNGAGMEAAVAARIFEPFFTTKAEGLGTGLGLSTVYGIISQNEGLINVYSEPDLGTTFKIFLPRAQARRAKAASKRETTGINGHETVLVVEDEEQILRLCAKILKRYGYRVLEARSPAEALSICQAQQEHLHLLLTDVVMPGMNGKELKQRVEQIKPEVKTLFMSGYTANVIIHRGVMAEGELYIQKPFSPVKLAQKVRQVLDG